MPLAERCIYITFVGIDLVIDDFIQITILLSTSSIQTLPISRTKGPLQSIDLMHSLILSVSLFLLRRPFISLATVIPVLDLHGSTWLFASASLPRRCSFSKLPGLSLFTHFRATLPLVVRARYAPVRPPACA